jgi:5-methylcytosine-specific restriction endonuclease McrA
LRRHTLRFEVTGEVLATFRDAMAKLRRDAGGPLDDDSALWLMARQVLGGPLDEGRASYQVVLSVCEQCKSARQRGRGELVEVATEVVQMAHCDAQQLASPHVGAQAKGRTRAKQDIPPARRREVLHRDRQRCVVPGCRHATFLDVHHIQPREEGGHHEADNLVTLCSAHHRAAHRGELVIEGRVSTGLQFRHADGTDYGGVTNVASSAVDAQTKAFQALRRLGFGERESRQALAEVLAEGHPEASVETTLRNALERLAAGAIQRAS